MGLWCVGFVGGCSYGKWGVVGFWGIGVSE